MSSQLERELRKLLRETDIGLSINELAEKSGHRATSVRRCVAFNMPDVYIAQWREAYRRRPTALYRAAIVPDDAPEPPRKPINVYKNKSRDERPKAAKVEQPKAAKAEKVEPFRFKLAGLTTIRGPWPQY